MQASASIEWCMVDTAQMMKISCHALLPLPLLVKFTSIVAMLLLPLPAITAIELRLAKSESIAGGSGAKRSSCTRQESSLQATSNNGSEMRPGGINSARTTTSPTRPNAACAPVLNIKYMVCMHECPRETQARRACARGY